MAKKKYVRLHGKLKRVQCDCYHCGKPSTIEARKEPSGWHLYGVRKLTKAAK